MTDLSEDDLSRLFESRVIPYLEGLRTQQQGRGDDHDILFVSVGGQPGAGKSGVLASVHAATPGMIYVNGDELRQMHPDYSWLMDNDPLRMPDATAAAAGRWVGMSTAYLREQKISAVVETTLRDSTMLQNEFQAFKDAGYSTALRVVAVPIAVSRQGILSRYLEQVADYGAGRWTPSEHHDRVAKAVPHTVAALTDSGTVDRVTVQARDGQISYDATPATTVDAVAAVNKARAVTNMTKPQALHWVHRLESDLKLVAALPPDRDIHHVAHTLATVDAQTIVKQAFPGETTSQQQQLAQLAAAARNFQELPDHSRFIPREGITLQSQEQTNLNESANKHWIGPRNLPERGR